jgi:hypothetical protein
VKNKLFAGLVLIHLAVFNFQLSTAHAQGTAFTYQGRLNGSGSALSGLYDFRFKLFADPLGNTQVGANYFSTNLPVTGGLFVTTIDFGAGVFNGSNYWLEVDVRTNNPGNTLLYTPLTPLQALTPTPYAVFANTASNLLGVLPTTQLSGTLPAGQLAGTYGNAVTLNNAGNSFSGNGGGLTNLNASQLAMGVISNILLPGFQASLGYVSIGGGTGNTATGYGDTIAGGSSNSAAGLLATISGGNGNGATGNYDAIAGGRGNSINGYSDNYCTVGGGQSNNVGFNFDTIAGGSGNNAGGNNYGYSTVGGGLANQANNDYSTVGGGQNNYNAVVGGTISGGEYNQLLPTSFANGSVVGGGFNNTNSGSFATIPGGSGNFASGNYALAAGVNAAATNDGAFVWADNEEATFSSTTTNQFNVRANGGVRFVTGGAGITLDGQTVLTSSSTLNGNNVANFDASQLIGVVPNGALPGFQAPSYSVMAGGVGNTVGGVYTTVGGGENNTNSSFAGVVGGGQNNLASGVNEPTVAGGSRNTASGDYSFVGGGVANTASGSYATVPGGLQNVASGVSSLAAGDHAQATNDGAFVWADDSTSGAFASTGNNQFLIRANGNVGINTTTPGSELTLVQPNAGGRGAELSLVNPAASTVGNEVAINFATDPSTYNLDNPNAQIKARSMNLDNRTDLILSTYNGSAFAERLRVQSGGNIGIANTNPAYLLVVGGSASPAYCNGTTWQNGSDRNIKNDFSEISPLTVLAKVSALPITEWQYKLEAAGTRHIGPMAQDFHAAFGLNGADDKHISTVDEGGVALAAIQGLNQKLTEKDAEIQELKQRLETLEKIVLKSN